MDAFDSAGETCVSSAQKVIMGRKEDYTHLTITYFRHRPSHFIKRPSRDLRRSSTPMVIARARQCGRR
jgi:hypothetical protein